MKLKIEDYNERKVKSMFRKMLMIGICMFVAVCFGACGYSDSPELVSAISEDESSVSNEDIVSDENTVSDEVNANNENSIEGKDEASKSNILICNESKLGMS